MRLLHNIKLLVLATSFPVRIFLICNTESQNKEGRIPSLFCDGVFTSVEVELPQQFDSQIYWEAFSFLAILGQG